MKESVDIIIAGVGGQGNVLASQIYAAAAVEAGLKVAVGETYGAAQRGGSVVSHLRISEDCKYGPLIPRGRAEAIVGLEPLEALRAVSYTHLRAHETVLDLVCRLLLEKKK